MVSTSVWKRIDDLEKRLHRFFLLSPLLAPLTSPSSSLITSHPLPQCTKAFVDRGLLKSSVDFICILRRKGLLNLPALRYSPPLGELEGVSFASSDTFIQAKRCVHLILLTCSFGSNDTLVCRKRREEQKTLNIEY